jgi:hypothetical protein
MTKQLLHRQRARAVGAVLFSSIVFGASLFQPAHAYVGQELLSWIGDNIVFPLGILSIVLSLAAALFRPDLLKSGLYATGICALIFFIIRAAPQLQAVLQAG